MGELSFGILKYVAPSVYLPMREMKDPCAQKARSVGEMNKNTGSLRDQKAITKNGLSRSTSCTLVISSRSAFSDDSYRRWRSLSTLEKAHASLECFIYASKLYKPGLPSLETPAAIRFAGDSMDVLLSRP